jgi:DNA-binding transcriptional LysR family regulator
MDLGSDMRVFVRVVEHQSFSGAASVLGLTPSAVSKLVGRLENRLGVRLLHRTTRRLALTPEGEIYFGRARQILADIDEAEAEVAKSRAAPRGHLRINTYTAFAAHQLAPALPEFLKRYPEIKVDLAVTDRLVDPVEESADVMIRSGHLDNTSLSARKFAEIERTICASPAYLEKHGVPRTPADLATHSCILITVPSVSRWPFRVGDRIEHVEIAPIMTTDNGEALLQLALEGAGIVRLADLLVGEPIRQGRMVPILTDVHHVERLPLSALYLAGRHRLPKVRVFLDFLVERFSSVPWRVDAGRAVS